MADVRLLVAYARANRYNQAIVNKQVGDIDSAAEEAARIETQIQYQAFDPFLVQLSNDSFQVLESPARELIQSDVINPLLRIEGEIPTVVVVSLEADNAFQL